MSLAHRSFGSGRPLVLLHGLFGSGDNLRVLARGLETICTVILPDLPNHGESPHLASSTLEVMTEAVEDFLSRENLENAILGGHSIGGKIAMLLALRNAQHVPALICLDMAPRRYDPSHTAIIAGMRDLPLDAVHTRRDADELLMEAVPNAAVRGFLIKNLVRDGEQFRWRLNLAAIAADYDRLLGWDPPDASYDRHALFVGGGRSPYLNPERDASAIHRWFPAARITTIPDAGHWLHADRPEELLTILRLFLTAEDS